MRHAAQTVEQAPVNSALLNVVTPIPLGRISERHTELSVTRRKWMWNGFLS